MEDETGLVETVWFPQAYRTSGAALDHGLPVRIHGRIQREFGVVTVQVEHAEVLRHARWTTMPDGMVDR